MKGGLESDRDQSRMSAPAPVVTGAWPGCREIDVTVLRSCPACLKESPPHRCGDRRPDCPRSRSLGRRLDRDAFSLDAESRSTPLNLRQDSAFRRFRLNHLAPGSRRESYAQATSAPWILTRSLRTSPQTCRTGRRWWISKRCGRRRVSCSRVQDTAETTQGPGSTRVALTESDSRQTHQ